ncbi:MAG: tryptophan synthase subunit alpha [Candidatus Margulisbacteria bacterium]|jgi:tryptophan synthase alpha chain|nr:tryptophan synthase subunit alpha [Candidatus Margulisiibacteriota bacterium]
MSDFWANLHKPLIVPLLWPGNRRDKRRLSRWLKKADVLQIILPDNGVLGIHNARLYRSRADFSLAALLQACQQIRRKNSKKLILQAGVNNALAYGLRSFFADLAAAGVDALTFRDLPLEESEEFLYLSEQQNMPLFLQAADSAPEDRLAALLEASPQGLLAVAAAQEQENQAVENLLNTVRRLKKKANVPVLIDYALAEDDNLRKAYQTADGLLLPGLLDLPERCAMRRLKNIRRILSELK